jgi:hypothetical protein
VAHLAKDLQDNFPGPAQRELGRRNYFGLESGGQSGDTFIGLPPLCTVGAAEFEPPASGSTALFSTAIELAVFSSPLPVVAAGDVVQAVSGLSPDAAVDWAAAVPTLNIAAKIAAATWIILVSDGPNSLPGGKRSGATMVPGTSPAGSPSWRARQRKPSLAGAGPRDDTATGLVWFSLEVAAQEILQAQQDRLRQAGAPAVAIENGIETADPWGTKVRLIKV